MSGNPGTQAFDGGADTVRDFWVSRPRRPRHGRKIAGVAAGIGDRYGIDPVLVRVALIVATVMGGIGVFVYLLGWLLLPEEGDEVSALEALFGKGHSSMPPPLTVCLSIALFPASGWAFGGMWFGGGGFLLMAGLAAALFLLHRSRGDQHRPVPVAQYAGGAPADFQAQAVTDIPGDETSGDSAPRTDSVAAPGWDPLAADPLGWNLSEPQSRPQAPAGGRPPARGRSVAAPISVAAALVTAGIGLALNMAGVEWFSIPHVIGLTLAVLGGGLLFGAVRRGRTGPVLIALPLAIAGILLTSLPFGSFPDGGFGELKATPRTLAELRQQDYTQTAGSVDLDLTELGLTEGDDEIFVEVKVGAGEAKVTVPEDADVTYRCSASMGEVDCLETTSGMHGMNDESDGWHTSYGDDGLGGPKIKLDVSARMGQVEISRG